jgi:hypothetical protein
MTMKRRRIAKIMRKCSESFRKGGKKPKSRTLRRQSTSLSDLGINLATNQREILIEKSVLRHNQS